MRDINLIDLSIKKWPEIVFELAEDGGRTDCPLCNMYWDNSCASCPIQGFTQKEDCRLTPYTNFRIMHFINDVRGTTKDRVVAANWMLSFLYEIRLWYINQVNKRR